MGERVRWLALIGAVIVCWSRSGTAQANESVRVQRFRGESFVLARYGTGGVASLYVATRVDRSSMLAGASKARQAHGVTSIIGVGTRLRLAPSVSTGMFIALARTPDDYQARLYVLPKVVAGRAALSAIGLLARPADAGRQFSVNPVTAAVRITSWLHAGGAVVAEHIGQKTARTTAGPAAHLRIRSAVMSVEALGASTRAQPDLRLSITAHY